MMPPPSEYDFVVAQITAIEARIILYNTAILAVFTQTTSSYSFDDGQTRQTVTQRSLGEFQRLYDSLLNQRATLYAMLGRGSAYVRPGY